AQHGPVRPPVKAPLRLAPLGLDRTRTAWPLIPIRGRGFFRTKPDISLVMKTGHFHLLITARIDLATALRWAARLGLSEGICNHFSYAVTPNGDQFLVNPLGVHWTEIIASDIVRADKDRNILEGNRKVEDTAFFIHSRIHLSQPTARCVLHTHMPY